MNIENHLIDIKMLEHYRKEDSLSDHVLALIAQQQSEWSLARNNYETLQQVNTKKVDAYIQVQFNPSRIISSAAKIDTKTIQERKCFLCAANLPQEQKGILYQEDYIILCNPFPIFPSHLTIPSIHHTNQRILSRMCDMLDLAKDLQDFIVFYNGPKCGASAPDHMHFQAGNKGFVPLQSAYEELIKTNATTVCQDQTMKIHSLERFTGACLVIESENQKAIIEHFNKIYKFIERIQPNEAEPMMNVICWFDSGRWIVAVFPRKLHRPWQYFAEDERNILLSPGAVDVAGVLITPVEKDFIKITKEDIADIFDQISIEADHFSELIISLKN